MRKIFICGFLTSMVLIIASCTGTKKMNRNVNDYYQEDSSIVYPDNDWYSIQFYPSDSFTENARITKLKKRFIPAIVYWNWNSTLGVEQNPAHLENELRQAFQRFTDSVGMKEKIGNRHLSIEVDSLEERSFYTDEGYVIFLLFAYSMVYGEYVIPEQTGYTFSYQISNEKGENISRKKYYSNRAEPLRNSFLTTRNFIFKYLNERKRIREEIYYEFFTEIVNEKLELDFYKPKPRTLN